MDLIFSLHTKRKLSKNLELSYKNEIFQIQCATPGYGMRHATVSVCEARDKTIRLIYKEQTLDYLRYKKNQRPVQIVDAKSLNKVVDKLVKKEQTCGFVDNRTTINPRPQHPERGHFNFALTVQPGQGEPACSVSWGTFITGQPV